MRPPISSRPYMPGYGIARGETGLLPWDWAVERLARARRYWVATSAADGEPHLAAVWGIWSDDGFWFSTAGGSRKARNLAGNPRCSVAPELADESVVVRGTARRVTEPDALTTLEAEYIAKYGEGFPESGDNPTYRVEPRTVIGIIENEPDFSARATRWTFES